MGLAPGEIDDMKKGSKISMQSQLNKFYDIPGFAEHTIHELKKAKRRRSGNLAYLSFKDGKFWQVCEQTFLAKKGEIWNGEKVIPFPLKAFYDSFNLSNPIGHSVKHTIGGNYVINMGMNEKYNSNVDYMMIHELFYSEYRKLSNRFVFNSVVDEFKNLAEFGISKVINGERCRLFPLLVLCAGDNLSVNEYMGFAESYSG